MAKYTKEEKQAKKLYLKQLKKYRKQLIKLAKDYDFFDWEAHAFEPFMVALDGFQWYYNQTKDGAVGWNVWAQELPDNPTRAEICNTIQSLYIDWKDADGIRLTEAEENWHRLIEYIGKHLRDLWD